jgi:hypothetical protein
MSTQRTAGLLRRRRPTPCDDDLTRTHFIFKQYFFAKGGPPGASLDTVINCNEAQLSFFTSGVLRVLRECTSRE